MYGESDEDDFDYASPVVQDIEDEYARELQGEKNSTLSLF